MAANKQNSTAFEYADESVKKDLKKGKRRFRIDAGNYGGELAVGTVDEAFVEHFVNKSEGNLIENLQSYQRGDEEGMNQGIPKPWENFNGWYEADDFVHLNSCYDDSGFSWCEVPIDGSDDYDEVEGDVKEFEAHHLYERETPVEFSKPNEDDIEEGDEWIPVLVYHSADKGYLGCWFAETNGEDFDPKKVAFSSVATYVASIVEDVWYDQKQLEHDTGEMSTTSKGDYAKVGWMNSRMHDTLELKQANIKAYWEDYEYTLEE